MSEMHGERRRLIEVMRYWPPELREQAVLTYCAKHGHRVRHHWRRDRCAPFGLFTVGIVLVLAVPDAPELTVETGHVERVPRWRLSATLRGEALPIARTLT